MNDAEKQQHPSFGKITVSRVHGSARRLFGTRVQHHETIRITVQGATLSRDLSRDWILSNGTIIELDMSPAQWATFISSFGQGDGTPVTLIARPEGSNIIQCPPPPPFNNERLEHEQEIDDLIKEIHRERDIIEQQVAALFAAKSVTKKDLSALRNALGKFINACIHNIPFVAESYKKTLHTITEEAKIEVEAFTEQYLFNLGLQAAQTAIPNERPAPPRVALDGIDSEPPPGI